MVPDVSDTLIALLIVAHGLPIVPQPAASLPAGAGATNVPYLSATTHGSVDGSSVFGAHDAMHPPPARWYPMLHDVAPQLGIPPSPDARHAGAPFAIAGHPASHPPQ